MEEGEEWKRWSLGVQSGARGWMGVEGEIGGRKLKVGEIVGMVEGWYGRERNGWNVEEKWKWKRP